MLIEVYSRMFVAPIRLYLSQSSAVCSKLQREVYKVFVQLDRTDVNQRKEAADI